MRTQIISAVCLLLTGLAVGFFFSPAKLMTSPTGELLARERVVDADMNVEVDLRIRNRPLGSKIEWHSDKSRFNPEVTETELRSTFKAPAEQGRIKLWVEIVAGEKRYKDVASTYLDISRTSADALIPSSTLPPQTTVAIERPGAATFAIKFITVPPYNSKGGSTTSADIEGRVEGVKDPEQYRIILYTKTDNTWWVQPLAAARYTPLDRNGQFFSWTHTGTRYAALLVRRGFVAQEAIDGGLPSGPDILARTEVNGRRKGE